MQTGTKVSQIPQPHCLVRRACGDQELRVRRKTEAVNLFAMSMHSIAWFIGWTSSVPDQKIFIVADAAEEVGVMIMPGNIFDNRRVASECGKSSKGLSAFRNGINIPKTDRGIITCRKQMTRRASAPCEPIPFFSVTCEAKLWITNCIRCRPTLMFGEIKNIHIITDCLKPKRINKRI